MPASITFAQTVFTLAKRFKQARPGVAEESKWLVRELARRRFSREAINRFCDRLELEEQAAFARKFAWVFYDTDVTFEPSAWTSTFAGKPIRLQLGRHGAWLDWMLATTLLGHDVDVKRCYESLLRSSTPPRVFFDVGANYGLHSLLLAGHGVRTVAFEPNPACHAFLRDACALNGFACQLEPIALDDRAGVKDFWFPETLTWLGTMDEATAEQVRSRHPDRHIRVPTTTLDEYVERHGLRPDLLKIDAEGNELRIVSGGEKTLATCRPQVVFESLQEPRETRRELARAFEALGYRIAPLPLGAGPALDGPDFVESPISNFLAAPEERLQGGRLPA